VETFIRERAKVSLRNPVLIEGFPGLGYVGKITITYVARQLGAKRLAELYSPYFPYHVITSRGGGVRLPRAQFHYYQDPKGEKDLVFCTSDSQAQSLEGQFDVVEKILGYAKKLGVKTVVAIGGYSLKASENTTPVCVGTNKELLDRMLESGATLGPLGNPIVGLAGVTLGLAKLLGINAACILGQTIGHLPDPESAKRVLNILQRFLGITVDLQPLDKEIEKAVEVFREMDDVQREMESTTRQTLQMESKKVTYIS